MLVSEANDYRMRFCHWQPFSHCFLVDDGTNNMPHAGLFNSAHHASQGAWPQRVDHSLTIAHSYVPEFSMSQIKKRVNLDETFHVCALVQTSWEQVSCSRLKLHCSHTCTGGLAEGSDLLQRTLPLAFIAIVKGVSFV